MQVTATFFGIGIAHSFFLTRFPNVVMGIVLGMLLKRRITTFAAEAEPEPTNAEKNTTGTNTSTSSPAAAPLARALIVDGLFGIYVLYNVAYVPVFRFDGDIYLQFYLLPVFCVWLWWLVLVDEAETKARHPISPPPLACRLLCSSPMQAVGDWSYALYCLHWPSYFFLTWVFGTEEGGWFSTGYVWHRCLVLSQGNGVFGLEYYHLPFCLVFALLVARAFSLHLETPIRKLLEKAVG